MRLTCEVEVVLDKLLCYLAEVFVTGQRGEPCLGRRETTKKEEGMVSSRDPFLVFLVPPLPRLFESQRRAQEHVLTIHVSVDVWVELGGEEEAARRIERGLSEAERRKEEEGRGRRRMGFLSTDLP